MRRATINFLLIIILQRNFYPRSPCGERPTSNDCTIIRIKISIHALLAESDILTASNCFTNTIFLSTLSLRRATALVIATLTHDTDFYPRSPCGERLYQLIQQILLHDISIHALLAESDDVIAVMTDAQSISIHALLAESDFRLFFIIFDLFRFLSTLSLRRATTDGLFFFGSRNYFYPRSPCGERQSGRSMVTAMALFLSTLSLRRATVNNFARHE